MIIMITLTFYDTSEIDKQQLQNNLEGTECSAKFIQESISTDNVDPATEVLSVFVPSDVTREIIEKMPKLKLIVCRSTGFNNIDLEAAKKHKITVTNVPTYGENTVAEYAFMLILALSRKLVPTLQEVNSARIDHDLLHGFDLAGKTMGIIGMGRIGQHTARTAKGFGMEVVAFDPFPNEDKAKEIGYTYASLEELAAKSDVISLHAPCTKENMHVVGKDFLAKVKPTTILINTARGELVDTEALISALYEKRLAGAGLDVVEGEELEDIDHEIPLLGHGSNDNLVKLSAYINILEKMPNVILTPHNAYNTAEAIGRINKTSTDNILRFLKGEIANEVKALACPVN
jgi:D-lactate dehydrogenase